MDGQWYKFLSHYLFLNENVYEGIKNKTEQKIIIAIRYSIILNEYKKSFLIFKRISNNLQILEPERIV